MSSDVPSRATPPGPPSPIRVAIADDHELFRQGLRQLLANEPDIVIAAELANGRAVLNAADKDSWDVLLLDLSLPIVSGIEVIARLRESNPSLQVLVLSMYNAEHYGPRVRRAGAAGYLSKTEPSRTVVEALRRVSRGESLPAPVATQDQELLPHERLSAREHQVFMLLVQGRSVADIAAELDLTPSTVSTHVANLREKLGVQNLAEIIRYAFQAGLVGDY
ncbi:MAG: response regulator transcription factor [Sandaracinaceae bacterium]|nr:response regulator transcription factor [Sandaracinaceae bacterium]